MCLSDTCRENHYLFTEANVRIFDSLEYCLGEAVLSTFQMALLLKPRLDQPASLLLLYSELIKLSLFGFIWFIWLDSEWETITGTSGLSLNQLGTI